MSDLVDEGRRRFIRTGAAALAVTRLGVIGSAIQQMACAALVNEGTLPSLSGATEWINSPPLTSEGLRGKVVLVDFWTYTCANWTRTLPYIRAFAEKYRDQGLVVIGAHTPEFPFEHDVDNIRWYAKTMGVNYPIAVDSDYGIWRAFDNNYWPAVYIADATGRIRYHHFGEAAYDEQERVIQRLLRESHKNVNGDLVKVNPRGLEVAADYVTLRSQETYLGYERGDSFAGDAHQNTPQNYTVPSTLQLNQWALGGNWTVQGRPVVLNQPNGKIAFRYHARDVNLIMCPPSKGESVPFTVRVDGKPPGAGHGEDTDAQGNGVLTRQRCYQLVRLNDRVTDRTFEIEFSQPGVEAYDFTFG